jgi:DNA-binding MarR family transcriptional regulator
MDPQDIRYLQILEEIENSYRPSQRDLARKLNISLGLVNSFIKRLAKKGYVKVTTIPKNRVKYILTPQGFAEKSRLTYEFIQYSLRFYKKALVNIQDLLDEFQRIGITKVVFYGANDLAEIAYISMKATNVALVGVIDDSKKGKTFQGYTVKSLSELGTLDFERIIITSLDSKEAIYTTLIENEIPKGRIITLE